MVARFVALCVVLLIGACGGEEDPGEIAMAYAQEKSGGVTSGCLSAEAGEEAEEHPGCIFAAAYAGCMEGLTGEELGGPVKEQFPEPGLQQVHRDAVSDCRK